METVLITGGTGFVGRSLSALLTERGYHVIVLSRSTRNNTNGGVEMAHWDVDKQTIDISAIQKANYIIHLAGAGVADKRWTAKRKQEIVDSRTKSSALIIKTLKENSNHVKAVISASGVGWYGEDAMIPNAQPFVETDPADNDFLGNTCVLWEDSIEPVVTLNKRLVKFRTGVVLGNDAGALPEFKKPLQFGIAAILGSGKQVISWIHIDDLCRMFLHAIENTQLNGVYNAVAPLPVSNKDLMLKLAKAARRKFYIPVYVPSFLLKLLVGGVSIEVLKSTTVSVDKIRSTGFTFLYPSIDAALNQLIKHR